MILDWSFNYHANNITSASCTKNGKISVLISLTGSLLFGLISSLLTDLTFSLSIGLIISLFTGQIFSHWLVWLSPFWLVWLSPLIVLTISFLTGLKLVLRLLIATGFFIFKSNWFSHTAWSYSITLDWFDSLGFDRSSSFNIDWFHILTLGWPLCVHRDEIGGNLKSKQSATKLTSRFLCFWFPLV